MQPYDPYNTDRPYIIEKKRAPRKKGRLIALLLLISAAVSIGIVVFYLTNKRTFTVKGRVFYAVVMTETSVEAEAVSVSTAVKYAGGGGYILNDGTYKVVAAVYPDAQSAESVSTRLNASGSVSTVSEVKIGNMKRQSYEERSVMQTVSDAIRYVYVGLYDKLYAVSLELDEKRISESAAVKTIAGCRETTDGTLDALSDLLLKYPADKGLVQVRNLYVRVAETLEAARSAESVSPSSRIKYAISDLLFTAQAFAAA